MLFWFFKAFAKIRFRCFKLNDVPDMFVKVLGV